MTEYSSSSTELTTARSSSEFDTPPRKKRHIDSKYQASWSHKYRMTPSKLGNTYAHCTVCGSDFSVSGGGVHQVKRHCNSKKHCDMMKGQAGQSTLHDVLDMHETSKAEKLKEQVLCAELYFTRFIVEHNLSFAVADHFNNLCGLMFPDSRVAAQFSCARTKTKALVTHALAPEANSLVINACQEQPFTILCDGGNNNFEKKYFGIMVRFWDNKLDRIATRFLEAPVVNIATGETLFQALDEALSTRSIPWENVVGFASDSASVMAGKRNSVLSRVIQKQENVFSLGCVCHLAALCAAGALKKLPVSIDNLLIDIYYHFKHSSKRCEEFGLVVKDFDGIAPVRVLKHCSTRWLSLERALDRLLLLWPALFTYFNREVGNADKDRVKRVEKLLGCTETKLFCHFVSFALKPLNKFNIAFQSMTSKIGNLQEDVRNLLRAFLSNFIKPELLASILNSDIHKCDYKMLCNQLCNDEIGIGTATRLLLIENADEFEGTSKERTFFSSVRNFYMECVKKIIDKFPFTDDVIVGLGMLNPANRHNITSTVVMKLVRRFYKQCTVEQIDSVMKEWQEYKSIPDSQLPTNDNLETFWSSLGRLPMPASEVGDKRFGNLASFCKLLLVLPHSNADPERLFSIVGSIETSHRSSLLPSTVNDILAAKINLEQKCFQSQELFTPHLLAEAKTATKRSLSAPVSELD